MARGVLLVGLVLLAATLPRLLASSPPAAPAGPVALPSGEIVRFKTASKSTGALIYEGEYRYKRTPAEGGYHFQQIGHFRYAGGNVGVEETHLGEIGGRLLPRSWSITVRSPAGQVVRTGRIDFEAGGRRAHVVRTYNDPTGKDDLGVTDEIDKRVDVPEGTFARPMFDAILRVSDFKPGTRRAFHVITRVGELFPVNLVEDGQEPMTMPFGQVTAQRIRLIPDLPLLPSLMPSLTIRLWYTADAPHLPLRFEGFLEPPPPYLQDEVKMTVTEIVRG